MRLQSTKNREVCTLISAGGWRRRGRADSVEGVGARSGSKGAHSTKDGNPYGWLALGLGARGRGFGLAVKRRSLVGRRDVLKHIPEYHIRFTILSQ